MTKVAIEKMSQNTEPIWPVIEESINYNSSAYLQKNDLSPKEKEEQH
jgi:hypothetical protein